MVPDFLFDRYALQKHYNIDKIRTFLKKIHFFCFFLQKALLFYLKINV